MRILTFTKKKRLEKHLCATIITRILYFIFVNVNEYIEICSRAATSHIFHNMQMITRTENRDLGKHATKLLKDIR